MRSIPPHGEKNGVGRKDERPTLRVRRAAGEFSQGLVALRAGHI
jgi:hypothetical protein